MRFFSKKKSPDDDRKQRPVNEPFIADDYTVARVVELMRMFNDAVGNFDMVLATAKDISSAAGLRNLEQLLTGNAAPLMQRPWKMLAAVALRASQNGDHILVGKIFGFTYYWGTQIAPHMDRADMVDVLMSTNEPTIEAEIAIVALRSMQQLSVDQVILGNDTGFLTAGDLMRAAAVMLVQAPEQGVPINEVVMTTAKNLVG